MKLGIGALAVLATPFAIGEVSGNEAQAEYKGQLFYHSNTLANWWHSDGQDWYFFKDGRKYTGYGKDNSGTRYFVNGNYANWWYNDGSDWYFFKDGRKYTGWSKDNAGEHYYVNGKYANGRYNGKNYVNGKEESIKDGYVSNLFYRNNQLANWWYDDGQDWYFFKDGRKYTGWGKDNAGEHYYVNGKYANWWYYDGQDWYFFQNGKKHNGIGRDSSGMHYFVNGKYYKNSSSLETVLNITRNYLGVQSGSEEHKKIVDAYNSVNPKPVGYTAKYSDDWCDIFVTTVFQQAGLSHLIGRECGVQRHIGILEQKGIWKGRTQPKVGDIVTFDWDGGGWADHIGIVESVNNGVITTIEGNSAQYAGDTNPTKVNRKTYNWDSRYIKGYARPMY